MELDIQNRKHPISNELYELSKTGEFHLKSFKYSWTGKEEFSRSTLRTEFDNFEKFLKSQSNTLEELSLNFGKLKFPSENSNDTEKIQIKLPKFIKLEKFFITLGNGGLQHNHDPDPNYYIYPPVQMINLPDIMPNLREISYNSINFLDLFLDAPCLSLRNLIISVDIPIDYETVMENSNDLFPNVVQMEIIDKCNNFNIDDLCWLWKTVKIFKLKLTPNALNGYRIDELEDYQSNKHFNSYYTFNLKI